MKVSQGALMQYSPQPQTLPPTIKSRIYEIVKEINQDALIFLLLTKHLGGEFSHSLMELLCHFIFLSFFFFGFGLALQPSSVSLGGALKLHSDDRMTCRGGMEVNNSWHRR